MLGPLGMHVPHHRRASTVSTATLAGALKDRDRAVLHRPAGAAPLRAAGAAHPGRHLRQGVVPRGLRANDTQPERPAGGPR